jgi:ABC-2 type transport system ATP-binding protein
MSIIRLGKTVETGTLSELRHLTRTSVNADLAATPPPGLASMTGVHDAQVDGTRVRFEVDTDRLDGVLRLLTDIGLRSLTCQPPTLEELFLRHYEPEPVAGQAVTR